MHRSRYISKLWVRIRIRFKVDTLDANPWHVSLSYEEQVNVNDVVAQIKVLRLSKNKLREIPKTICKLSSLHTLSVRENNLIYLPLDLHKLQVTHSYRVDPARVIQRDMGHKNVQLHP